MPIQELPENVKMKNRLWTDFSIPVQNIFISEPREETTLRELADLTEEMKMSGWECNIEGSEAKSRNVLLVCGR